MDTIRDERGPCLVCGRDDSACFMGLHNGPYCNEHGSAIARGLDAMDRARNQVLLIAGRKAGRQYWTGRGILVGAEVVAHPQSMLGPFGGSHTVRGIAKVGINGAYVLADQGWGKQHLAPDYFNAANPRRLTREA